MDRALWLLLELRAWAWIRRVGRMLGTVRGALLLAVGCVIFGGWILALFFQAKPVTAEHLADVRRYGPLVLVGLFLVNLVFSTGERAITFTPAEVNLLFPAPLSRRQLLAYKLTGSCGAAVLTAFFMAIFLRQHLARFDTAFVGLALTMIFLNLLTMLLALLASAVGVRAYNRRRKLILLVLVVAFAAGLYQQSSDLLGWDWQHALEGVEQSRVVQVLLEPLRWFLEAATAERLWPDLLKWSALAVLVDLALVGLVLAMDAQYLEASASASEKTYARLQRVRHGGLTLVRISNSGRVRFSLPSLPTWGGLGPLAWRQLTTVMRDLWTLVIFLVIFAFFFALTMVKPGPGAPSSALAWFVPGLTLFAAPILPFDFRGDLDRMDMLKSLPLPAWRIAAGQLLAPVFVLLLFQWLALALIQVLTGLDDAVPFVMAVFLLPVNVLILEIENLCFLWFPTRLSVGVSDFQSLGRQMLLWIVKMLTLVVTVGIASLAGLAAYLLGGQSWIAALSAGWLVVAAVAAGLLPLVALAFQHFDVAADVPP
jgi:hypothetical protein